MPLNLLILFKSHYKTLRSVLQIYIFSDSIVHEEKKGGVGEGGVCHMVSAMPAAFTFSETSMVLMVYG